MLCTAAQNSGAYSFPLAVLRCLGVKSLHTRQNRLPTGLCHHKHICEDLLFIQLCSDSTPLHCNTVRGRKRSPLSSAAVQNRLPAGLCHCKHTCEDLLFIQLCSDPTPCTATLFCQEPQLSSAAVQNRLPAGCATTITPVKACCSYSCAVTQHQCIATLFLAESNHRCPRLLCKIGCQQACVTANTPVKICLLAGRQADSRLVLLQ